MKSTEQNDQNRHRTHQGSVDLSDPGSFRLNYTRVNLAPLKWTRNETLTISTTIKALKRDAQATQTYRDEEYCPVMTESFLPRDCSQARETLCETLNNAWVQERFATTEWHIESVPSIGNIVKSSGGIPPIMKFAWKSYWAENPRKYGCEKAGCEKRAEKRFMAYSV